MAHDISMKRPLEASLAGLDRVVTLTDGVFAIALTLIVLEIHVPPREAIHSEADLLAAIGTLGPRFLTYAISFLVLTIFWFGQQAQHQLIARTDRRLATIHLCFLGFIALLPFSTGVLADFLEFRTAIGLYWLNMLMLGVTLYAGWSYASRHDLLSPEATPEIRARVKQRIIRAQIWWAFGAALCIISPLLSIAVILVIQLLYAIAPPWRWLRRVVG